MTKKKNTIHDKKVTNCDFFAPLGMVTIHDKNITNRDFFSSLGINCGGFGFSLSQSVTTEISCTRSISLG